jgi:hypothetical protein
MTTNTTTDHGPSEDGYLSPPFTHATNAKERPMTETRDPEDHRPIETTFGLTWTPGRDKDGQPPNEADMFAGERAAWGPDWDKPAVRTDALLARLEVERAVGGVVMYRPAGDDASHAGFVFGDTTDEHGEVVMGNALTVPKAAITPAVEDWIASHCTWIAADGRRRTP